MIDASAHAVFQLPVETEEMCGAFSPDRTRLLTGGDGAVPKVQIWDVKSGNCLQTFRGHKEPVAALAWTQDQRWVASGAFDRCVRLWNVSSGEGLCLFAAFKSSQDTRSVL